jgi:hypothetical protein
MRPAMPDAATRHLRLRTVFDAALTRDPSTRDAYLLESCGDDVELRREVARLLAAADDAAMFLEQPVQRLPDLIPPITRPESIEPSEAFPGN